ncbi:MAG: hypothetical protein LBL34_03360 [Clostridiales bacterium]|jgi:hypothetical protein|nr:hypothetical protein [Clostridiales bacterium]
MVEKNDWRLQSQDKYLKGAELKKKEYKPASETWDHDHCVFCNEKFMLKDGCLKQGYYYPTNEMWICENCYDDFKEMFEWEL